MKILLTAYILILFTSNLYAEKVKIGVSLPLSGNASTYGTDVKNALIFANKQLSNNEYELIIEDDKCIDREAVNIANKLVNIDKVKYILGLTCSGAVLASAPVYEKNKVTVIASGGGAPDIIHAGDYIFRTIPNLEIAAKKLFAHMNSNYKNIGIITEETAYCQGLTDSLIEKNRNNISITNESFLSDTSDFRTILTKMKSKKVEALFINTQTEVGLVTIYKQLQTLNWHPQVYSAYWAGSPTFLNAFGSKADGVIYSSLPFNNEVLNTKGLEVYSEFEKKYGPPKSGEFLFTLSYIAFDALNKAIISKVEPRDYLYENKFSNIVDNYSFDRNGDIISNKITFVLKTIKDGKPSSIAKHNLASFR